MGDESETTVSDVLALIPNKGDSIKRWGYTITNAGYYPTEATEDVCDG